jgi:hypothetical protein
VTLGGVFIMLTGLIRDARMHQLDPQLAAREGVLALNSPANRLFAVGLALIVMGVFLFLTGELFKGRGVSLLRRAASAGMVVLLALLSVNAFVVAVSGQNHQHPQVIITVRDLAPRRRTRWPQQTNCCETSRPLSPATVM